MNNVVDKYCYAVIGESTQTIYFEKPSTVPQDYILMQTIRPENGNYIAKEDGTWIEFQPTPEEEYEEMIRQRDQMLDENDWTILRHKDQVELEIPTTLSPEAYKNTLIWRQQLRDMPQTFGSYKAGGPAPKWTWPPVPPELDDDFPDYPPA